MLFDPYLYYLKDKCIIILSSYYISWYLTCYILEGININLKIDIIVVPIIMIDH